VAAVQVVGAVGRNDRDRPVEGPGEEEAEQVARGPVGPVGVLDDQQHRAPLGDGLEQGVDGAEQVGAVEGVALALAVAVVGREHPAARLEPGEGGVDRRDRADDVGQVGGEAAERLGERQVGQGAVAEVQAVAGDDLPPLGVGEVAELQQQPGLADPRVARQQDDPTLPGAAARQRTDAERGGDLRQLGVSADQGRARVRHGLHDVGGRGHRSSALRGDGRSAAGLGPLRGPPDERQAHPAVPVAARALADPVAAVVGLGLDVDAVAHDVAPRCLVGETRFAP
jgi:hypothetical protein